MRIKNKLGLEKEYNAIWDRGSSNNTPFKSSTDLLEKANKVKINFEI